jgi:hypothetical protein
VSQGFAPPLMARIRFLDAIVPAATAVPSELQKFVNSREADAWSFVATKVRDPYLHLASEKESISFGMLLSKHVKEHHVAVDESVVHTKLHDFSINFPYKMGQMEVIGHALRLQKEAQLLMTPFGNVVGWGRLSEEAHQRLEAAGARVFCRAKKSQLKKRVAPGVAPTKPRLVEVEVSRVDGGVMDAAEVQAVAKVAKLETAVKAIVMPRLVTFLLREGSVPDLPGFLYGIWVVNIDNGGRVSSSSPSSSSPGAAPPAPGEGVSSD